MKEYTSARFVGKHMKNMGASNEVIEYAISQVKMRDKRIERLVNQVSTLGRDVKPVSERSIEVIDTDKNRTIVKVNPMTGKVTLMLNEKKTSAVVRYDIMNIIHEISKYEFPPLVLTGNIHWQSRNEFYQCTLYCKSKIYHKTFVYEPCI